MTIDEAIKARQKDVRSRYWRTDDPADVLPLLDALDAILAMHEQDYNMYADPLDQCSECADTWPCNTRMAVLAAFPEVDE